MPFNPANSRFAETVASRYFLIVPAPSAAIIKVDKLK